MPVDLRTRNSIAYINLNNHICQIFKELQDKIDHEYITSGEKRHLFRKIQIGKATKVLANLDFKIERVEQIRGITGIGDGIKRRVSEILRTGTLKELEGGSSSSVQTIADLMRVHGVGLVTAREYQQKGITSVTELRHRVLTQANFTVPNATRLGLIYFDDLQLKISQELIDKSVQWILEQLGLDNPDSHDEQVIPCGSYRRGKLASGDIDLLFRGTGGRNMTSIVKELTKLGFIVAHLAGTGRKFMGICDLWLVEEGCTPRYGRIDMMMASDREWAYALLHLTGSGIFNRVLRSIALKKGYKLTEHCITHLATGKEIYLETEQEVFQFFDVCYLAPEQRNI